jgi:hypothetical protein
MKFSLRSGQLAPFRFQFPAIDVRISPLTDRSAHAHLQLMSMSLRVATKQSISSKHLFRPLVSSEEVQVMFA